jgi:alpha-glucosidase
MTKYFFLLLFAGTVCAQAQSHQSLTSPNGQLKVDIKTGSDISFSVIDKGDTLLRDCKIDLCISGKPAKMNVKRTGTKTIKETVAAPLYKFSTVSSEANAMTLSLRQNTSVEFRAYNEGVAYRFVTKGMKGEYTIDNEVADFNFAKDYTAWMPYSTNKEKPKAMAFQAQYDVAPLSQSKAIEAFLPVTVDCGKAKVTILESDVEAYPGIFVKGSKAALKCEFAKRPKAFDYYPWRKQKYVTATEDYIARCEGNRTFPWRVMVVTHDDKEMPVNTLVYSLASSNRLGNDTSWIKAGKVAWDWWNEWGVSNVNFKAGINQQTYKHYIDFAAKNKLEYIILDEGWYNPKSGDMLTVIPELNLQELVDYGKKKNVGIILWTVFNVLDDQLDAACDKYAAMGIKGFKVDFLDRNDQEAVEMVYRIAARCAKSHLVLDYHGIYPPTGINRTYPNVINFESVFGMEEAKWSTTKNADMPLYDVTYPFIRGMAGYVDFTPGGMRNASKQDFQPIYNNPMTMGTRCHQLANYIIDDSPLTMLADNPTIYEREKECTDFIASLPTVFDKMICVSGKMGEHIVIARQQGDNWYVGGQTNWEARNITVDFSFLPSGVSFDAYSLLDGINADKIATDYQAVRTVVTNKTKALIQTSSGGGFVIKLIKK